MRKIVECGPAEHIALSEIWERSVRASHDFLQEEHIIEIRRSLIPEYFPNVNIYGIEEDGRLAGFIGLRGEMIEMLFVDDDKRGNGYGSALIDHAIRYGATKVDVNEQNPSALIFYKAKGFRITGRDETDDCGRPYPILHLSL